MRGEPTVLVLGGGIAGLAASRELAQRGFKVTLLEARTRLGGRILTKRSQSKRPVELGAEFVHGRSETLWGLLEAIPLATVEASDQHQLLTREGGFRHYPFERRVERVTKRIAPREADESFKDFVTRNAFSGTVREAALSYAEGFHAAYPDRLSVQAFLATEEAAAKIQGDRAFRITRGYGALVDWFERELRETGVEIIRSVQANGVVWKPGEVTVKTRKGRTYQARACVVTLPLGVLKAGDVEFKPALREKKAAIASLELGYVTRVVLRFKKRFWPNHFGFLHTGDEWLPTWWTNEDPLSLTGWAGGPRGERTSQMTEKALRERAIHVLSKIFSQNQTRVGTGLLEFHFHNWNRDPYARMAYRYVGVNQIAASRELALPLASTLFFAGEATSLDFQQGTVHGALATGLRAAEEVDGW